MDSECGRCLLVALERVMRVGIGCAGTLCLRVLRLRRGLMAGGGAGGKGLPVAGRWVEVTGAGTVGLPVVETSGLPVDDRSSASCVLLPVMAPGLSNPSPSGEAREAGETEPEETAG